MNNPLETAPAITFLRASSGRPTAFLRWPDGRLVHLHSIVKPEAEGDFFSEIKLWGDVIVFLGTGLGYHVSSLIARIPRHSHLLLVDYYPELLDYCTSYVFTNLPNPVAGVSSATPDIRRQVQAYIQGARTIQFVKHPASYASNRQFYDRLAEMLSPVHSNSSASKWPRRALVFSGSFFLEKELLNAVSSVGTDPVPFEYARFISEPAFEAELSRTLQIDAPDLIVSVNMNGFDGSGIVAALSRRFGIPVAVWFVDDPHPILLHQAQFVNSHFHAFCWERAYIPWLAKKRFGKVSWLPLATDPELFAFAKRSGEPRTALGFVGSSMGQSFLSDIASRFLWSRELEPLAQKSAYALLKDPHKPIPAVIEETSRTENLPIPFTDDINRTWFGSYVIHLASMLRRKEVIGALIPLGIETFGDPEGWREMFGGKVIVHENIDYRNDLATTYQTIGINLNSTSCQMSTAVNQRVFDIPCCGGFIITDDREDLHALFADDEIVVYGNPDELKLLIGEYRGDRRAIEERSARARVHVLSEHTYRKRVETMIRRIFGNDTPR